MGKLRGNDQHCRPTTWTYYQGMEMTVSVSDLKVLIVDDNSFMINLTKRILGMLDITSPLEANDENTTEYSVGLVQSRGFPQPARRRRPVCLGGWPRFVYGGICRPRGVPRNRKTYQKKQQNFTIRI